MQSAAVLVSEEENLEYLIQSLQAEFELLIALHLALFAFHPSANDIQRNVDLLQQAPQVLQDVLRDGVGLEGVLERRDEVRLVLVVPGSSVLQTSRGVRE